MAIEGEREARRELKRISLQNDALIKRLTSHSKGVISSYNHKDSILEKSDDASSREYAISTLPPQSEPPKVVSNYGSMHIVDDLQGSIGSKNRQSISMEK